MVERIVVDGCGVMNDLWSYDFIVTNPGEMLPEKKQNFPGMRRIFTTIIKSVDHEIILNDTNVRYWLNQFEVARAASLRRLEVWAALQLHNYNLVNTECSKIRVCEVQTEREIRKSVREPDSALEIGRELLLKKGH